MNCRLDNLHWGRAGKNLTAAAVVAALAGCTAGYGGIDENGRGNIAFMRFLTSAAIGYGPEGFNYTSDPAADALKDLAATALATAAPIPTREAPQECPVTPWPQSVAPLSAKEPADTIEIKAEPKPDIDHLKERMRASKRRLEA